MSKTHNRRFQLSVLFVGLVLSAGLVVFGVQARSEVSIANAPPQVIDTANKPNAANVSVPKIQLAILLDTSNSMDGLIDQARNQLWQAVNEFSRLKRNGLTPSLEVAVYEYGNDGLSEQTGYIRQVTSLTRELDQVSEALFALTTNGGSEYCGYVIDTATAGLHWSTSDNDIKAIFIAGNEPFNQGPINFERAVKRAKQKEITVHTIHAGDYREGEQTGWKQGALLAGGNYMSIDANQKIVHIQAPQDEKIAELNSQLNKTYIPYGAQGKQKAQRQLEQDSKSAAVSVGLLAKRARSKASSMYNNANWDLVDAVEDGKVKLDKLETESLPEEMKSMNDQRKSRFVAEKSKERKKLKQEIAKLSKARDAYVATQKKKADVDAANTMNDALTNAIREQGSNKGFVSIAE
jgi:hypothetical protein